MFIFFEPCGYSINAIKSDIYYTIHITPEQEHSYISVETNDKGGMVEVFLDLFSPKSFDIVSFNDPVVNIPRNYTCRSLFKEDLSIGYHVEFSHFALDKVKRPHYFELRNV